MSARIDEAFVVSRAWVRPHLENLERSNSRDMHRGVDNLHLDGAIGFDPRRGKPRCPSPTKDHTSFGRSVNVLDLRARIKRAQSDR